MYNIIFIINVYCVCAVVRATDYFVGFTDLPINFPFDFEYVKEHLDPRQFRGQCERRQILHVSDVQLRPDLVGHVERRLPDNIHTPDSVNKTPVNIIIINAYNIICNIFFSPLLIISYT